MAAIHTGELLHCHPHLHALVTDGEFAPDGTFIGLPELEPEPFEKLWQRKVFELLLKRGKIDESLVRQMWSLRQALSRRLAAPGHTTPSTIEIAAARRASRSAAMCSIA